MQKNSLKIDQWYEILNPDVKQRYDPSYFGNKFRSFPALLKKINNKSYGLHEFESPYYKRGEYNDDFKVEFEKPLYLSPENIGQRKTIFVPSRSVIKNCGNPLPQPGTEQYHMIQKSALESRKSVIKQLWEETQIKELDELLERLGIDARRTYTYGVAIEKSGCPRLLSMLETIVNDPEMMEKLALNIEVAEPPNPEFTDIPL